jgi:hypothetical protein
MAKLRPGFNFTGTLGNLSAYKRKDLDVIILRTKWGPSREKINKDPVYDLTRRNNREFGGRSTASGWVLKALRCLRPLSDYNLAGPINTLFRPVQHMDTVNEWGRRNIELSKAPGILEGFPLNKRNVFESVVRTSLGCTINKEALTARLELPALYPGRNFFPVDQYAVFSWQVCLAVIPDLFFKEGHGYVPAGDFVFYYTAHEAGQWHPSETGADARVLELQLRSPAGGKGFSLLLAVGIQFGTVRKGEGAAVEYAGTGKILRVV